MEILSKIKNIAVIALATLGVLFLIIIFMPDSEEDTAGEGAAAVTEAQAEDASVEEEAAETEDKEEDASEETEAEGTGDKEEDASEETEAVETEVPEENVSDVDIPASELSDFTLSFKTTTLDGKKVTDDIFSDYDITVVYFWGTYCDRCIAEMGDYASFYKELPDNVNLVGIMGDVYDGLDNNVKGANSILNDAGAEFMNLKISDSVFDMTGNIRFIPSSFLVDREGHVIGELLEGAGYKDTRKALNKYLK